MRKILLLLIIFTSCSQEQPAKQHTFDWTEDQKRQYFIDSISNRMYNGDYGEGDSLNNFKIFAKHMFSDVQAINITDPNIYAFQEPYIDTSAKLPFKDWFRITVDPCFRIPYCFILEKKGSTSFLTSKMTDGYGGYYTGNLSFSVTKVFSDTLYNNVVDQLIEMQFWNLGEERIDGGDGETWTIEAIHNGKYNLIERWVPQKYGSKKTRELAKIGFDLREKSKMLQLLPILDSISPIDVIRQTHW